MFKKSKISSAAIRLKTGEVLVGRRHSDIINSMPADAICDCRKGFITKDGMFLDRKEAYNRAVLCGQTTPNQGAGGKLYSYMLYG